MDFADSILADVTKLVVLVGFAIVVWAGLTKQTPKEAFDRLGEMFKGKRENE